VTDPRPLHTRQPVPSGRDSPPPGGNRTTTIVVTIVMAALVIAFIVLHLTGVMGSGSH